MGDAVEITSLMKALGRTRREIESAIEKLVYRYQQDRGRDHDPSI